MDFTQICRTCLSTELLSPIFKDNIDANSFSAALSVTTGLKIAKNDGLPQNMCNTCTSFLQNVENFKRQCQAAEIKLLSIKETFVKEERKLEYQERTKVKKQKKHDSKNVTTKNLKKILGTASIKVKKEQITRQSNSCKNKSKITDMEAVNTDIIQKLDEEDLICKDRNIHKCDVNCDDNNFGTKYQTNYNNKTFRNDESFQADLVSEKNEDLTKKSDLELHESEYETEFIDLSFDSDTKEWFFIKEVLENSNIYNLKSKEILESYKKLKTKSITKTDEKLVDWDAKTVESDTKPVLTDTKIIETNTIIDCGTKIDAEKNVETETNMSKLNAKEQKHEPLIDVDDIDMKNLTEFDVMNEKTYNSENQLFEVNGSRVICKLCQKEMSRRSIVAHITARHPGSDERRAKCDFCDSHILKTQMKRHTNKMHGEKCSVCMYCHIEHSSTEELRDHVPKCTQKKRRRKTSVKDKECIVQCEICNKSMLKASLKMHQDARHRGIKPVCEHCGRCMGNKLRLQEHLRARHGHAKLQCALCEFRTASHTALTNHMRRHRGERPFVCEQCGAKFHAAYLLTQHKHAHRTRRDVKCEQCPAAFKSNNHLLMHRKSCHNNNIYQCEQCGRQFKCPQYLSKHVRALHPHTRTPCTHTRAHPAPTHAHTGDIQQ